MIQAQIGLRTWWWDYKVTQRIVLGDMPIDCILHYPHGYDEGADDNYVEVFKVFVDESEIIPWIKALPDYGQMRYVIEFDRMLSKYADMYIEIDNGY